MPAGAGPRPGPPGRPAPARGLRARARSKLATLAQATRSDQADAGEEEHQDGLDLPHQHVAQGDDLHAHAGERRGEALAQRCRVGKCAVPGLLERDAVAEAGEGVHPVEVAAEEVAPRLDGEVDARLPAGGEGEARREHADDGVRVVVEQERAAEHSGVAAHLRPPEGVAEHDRAGAAVLVLAGAEGAAELRTDAEDVEEVGGDPEGLELGALGAVLPGGGAAVVAGDGGEQGVVRLELADGGPGELEAGHVRVAVVLEQVHQALGLGVGEAAEERGVDGGEDGGVQADAHGEGEDDHGGEPRPGPEVAEGVPEVLEQGGHGAGRRFNGRARSGRVVERRGNEVSGTSMGAPRASPGVRSRGVWGRPGPGPGPVTRCP